MYVVHITIWKNNANKISLELRDGESGGADRISMMCVGLRVWLIRRSDDGMAVMEFKVTGDGDGSDCQGSEEDDKALGG
ncbi:unnamed protein product [Lactuca virosa]|uniref:Uncharacterized protein n=1 Tax=Lactuca virosa TaxID=75947 RepID=A0AAU9NV51_9ASTR|nr:unnamed protein product [Lactuca virosa]